MRQVIETFEELIDLLIQSLWSNLCDQFIDVDSEEWTWHFQLLKTENNCFSNNSFGTVKALWQSRV